MTPDDYTQIITAVLSVVLTGGLVTALVAWRKQRKQEPIDAETAAVVNARTAGELALALAKQQDGSIGVLREDLSIVREDLDATRAELSETRAELAAVRSTLSDVLPWIKDLFHRWDEHRKHPTPPGGLPPGIM